MAHCTTQQQQQQQHSNKKRNWVDYNTKLYNDDVVGTNWDVCDYDLPLKKRKIKKEKSNLGNDTNNDVDDAVWRNWEDWEYDLPIKKRKIKKEKSDLSSHTKNDDADGRNWDDWEYDLPIKKRTIKWRNSDYCEDDLSLKKKKINKEKSDLSYNNNNLSFLSSSIENNVSSTSHDNAKIDYKQETKNSNKKTCNVDDEWEIKKVLEDSDVNRALSRLMLKKELSQEFVIPVLLGGAKVAKKKGVEVQVWDVDTKSLHSLVFKIWTSAKSHVFNNTWVKDFVLRRELKKGDQIGLHWDQVNRRFNFSVISL